MLPVVHTGALGGPTLVETGVASEVLARVQGFLLLASTARAWQHGRERRGKTESVSNLAELIQVGKYYQLR